jgi:hypothetical protein
VETNFEIVEFKKKLETFPRKKINLKKESMPRFFPSRQSQQRVIGCLKRQCDI